MIYAAAALTKDRLPKIWRQIMIIVIICELGAIKLQRTAVHIARCSTDQIQNRPKTMEEWWSVIRLQEIMNNLFDRGDIFGTGKWRSVFCEVSKVTRHVILQEVTSVKPHQKTAGQKSGQYINKYWCYSGQFNKSFPSLIWNYLELPAITQNCT